jgi:hypothetical protein
MACASPRGTVEQQARPAQEARLEQRRLHGDVLERHRDALLDGAHARADLEAGVPAGGDEAGGLDTPAVAVAVAVAAGAGRTTSTSTSEYGNSSPRP